MENTENKAVKTDEKTVKANENAAKNEGLERRGFFRDGFFDPLFDSFFPEERHARGFDSNLMKTDIKESDAGYDLAIEVPGINKEDVKIGLDNGYLTISASHKSNNDEKNKNGKYIRRERFFGSYERSFYVGDIDKKDIHAKLNNGVLSIFVPKEKEDKEEQSLIQID